LKVTELDFMSKFLSCKSCRFPTEFCFEKLMAHFRSLQKNDIAIYCSFTHCKRAIERFVAHSLIVKEQMSNCLLICSLQKRKWAIVCSFALFKRAIARSIALSKRVKNERFPKLLIFHSKKKRSLIFKMSDCPTLQKSQKRLPVKIFFSLIRIWY